MTDQLLCPVCWVPTHDGLMDPTCTAKLRATIRALPDLMRELTVNYTRQNQAGIGNGGRGAEVALAFDYNSSEVRWTVANTVSTWIRDLADRHGEELELGNTMTEWCRWLLERMHRIRQHPAVAQIYDELTYDVSILRQAIDRPADREFVRTCVICGHGVYGPQGVADDAWVECGECRRVARRDDDNQIVSYVPRYQVGEARESRFTVLADALLTADDVAVAVQALRHEPLPGKTVHSWINRGRLLPVACLVESGAELYCVREAMELAAAIPQRRARERATA